MLFGDEYYRKDSGAGDASRWVEVFHRVIGVGLTERAKAWKRGGNITQETPGILHVYNFKHGFKV